MDIECGHRMQFQNSPILYNEENNTRRKINKESVLILVNEELCRTHIC